MEVLLIQTGGTIDKDYPETGLTYSFVISDPAAGRILKHIKPAFKYRIIELFKKDSSDLTDRDRNEIVKTCLQAKEDKIVISHGTDTMTQTAKSLDVIKNKVIVLTGSMRPERFVHSDAAFNLGMAIGALQSKQPGIYIAMSGLVLPYNQIKKDFDKGQFVKS